MQVVEPFGLTIWALNWLQSGIQARGRSTKMSLSRLVNGLPGASALFHFSEAEAGVHLQGSGLRKTFDIHVEE